MSHRSCLQEGRRLSNPTYLMNIKFYFIITSLFFILHSLLTLKNCWINPLIIMGFIKIFRYTLILVLYSCISSTVLSGTDRKYYTSPDLLTDRWCLFNLSHQGGGCGLMTRTRKFEQIIKGMNYVSVCLSLSTQSVFLSSEDTVTHQSGLSPSNPTASLPNPLLSTSSFSRSLMFH